MEGTIKWYNPKNGYGFIAGEDGGDYFVHFTAIPQGLKIYPDDKVSFDAVETEKGKQAQNVQKIGEAAPKASEAEANTELPAEEVAPKEEPEVPSEEKKEEVAPEAELPEPEVPKEE